MGSITLGLPPWEAYMRITGNNRLLSPSGAGEHHVNIENSRALLPTWEPYSVNTTGTKQDYMMFTKYYETFMGAFISSWRTKHARA